MSINYKTVKLSASDAKNGKILRFFLPKEWHKYYNREFHIILRYKKFTHPVNNVDSKRITIPKQWVDFYDMEGKVMLLFLNEDTLELELKEIREEIYLND